MHPNDCVVMVAASDTQIQAWQQQIAEGNENAFNNLFRHFYMNLVHFAMDLVHSRTAAEEIVSDVFVRIWQQRQEITRVEKMRVFLFVAVKNQSYNYLRRHSVWSVELTGNNTSILVTDTNPEEDMMFRELQLQLYKVVEQLPDQCRQVYKLIKEDGLKYKEVAEILQISPRTVETQLFRAIKKIRKVLLPEEEKKQENPNAPYAGNAIVLCLLFFS
ncbi:MAG: RNA polymerase sigma-70 factor [Chitinophagaceae bacterium]|nr:RNA polymerase sigma-70 factor [Chitinophagaceae bacterium]